MGFFDDIGSAFGNFGGTLGNQFGFSPTTNSYNFKAQAPQFVDQNYLQSLENQAQYAQGRPDTSSFAQALLAQAQQKNAAQANSLASSARGNVNPALLQREAMRQSSEANSQAGQQAGLISAQEALANRQLNDQNALAYRGMGLTAAQAQAQANLAAQGVNANLAGINSQMQEKNIGSLIGAGGQMGAAQIAGKGGGAAPAAALAYKGGHVAGEANIDGDHVENDTVPAMLSPGEIVIPRSKAKDPDKAKEFIDHIKGVSKKADHKGYGSVLEAKKKLEARVKELEAQLGKKK